MTIFLAACHHSAAVPAPRGDKIDCAIGRDAQLANVCEIDREVTPNGLMLTVHHPDGGFRRLLITTDGRGVIAGDGASPATVTPLGDHEVEVAIDDDRYHLPATVKGPKPAPDAQ